MNEDEGNEEKLKREIERLREHLLETEQTYASEILELENRVAGLKSEIAENGQTKESWEHLVNSEREFFNQLQAENDALHERLRTCELECTSFATKKEQDELAIQNLQNILREFESCKNFQTPSRDPA